ncbi:MAG: hypothetical protein HKM06_07125 [Spirochaetales bacterium]|nr:hypothetical protein [Spirochaetales bacterium]
MAKILCPCCQIVKMLIRQTEIFEEGGNFLSCVIEFYRCFNFQEEEKEDAQLDRNLKAARAAHDKL